MGRGRPQKPLALQKGNLTQDQQKTKELQESMVDVGAEQLEKLPTWLRDTLAKKEWKRLKEQLTKINAITNLDYNNLGAYCNAFSSFVEATKELKKQDLTIEHVNNSGEANIVENPLIRIQIKYSTEMKKYSGMLGLSADARLKLGSMLAETTEDTIKDEFGDI